MSWFWGRQLEVSEPLIAPEEPVAPTPLDDEPRHREPGECRECGVREHGQSCENLRGTAYSVNSELSSIDNHKAAQLVRYGAYAFVWVIGMCASVKLLTDFSAALKPLVLAALVSSILEWLVQFWEWFFWKAGNFVSMFLHKVWVFVLLVLLLLYIFCQGCYHLCCRERGNRWNSCVRERTRPYVRELCNWSLLRSRWHGSYAGQNSLLRFLAVLMTLTLVIAPLVALYTLIMSNVSAMLSKLSGYKDQLLRVIAYAHDHLNKLPEMMPKPFQNDTLAALQRMEVYMDADSMVQAVESYISNGLENIVSQTESVAIGMVFFFLYTFLWLFVPMHVNSHALKASTFQVLPWGGNSFLWANSWHNLRTFSYVEGEDEPLKEVQEKIYKVIWQYFLAMVIINAVYAGSVLTLLLHLGVDMSGFIAVACFFLGFIPELGTIISTVLPIILVALEPLAAEEAPPQPGASNNLQRINPFADWSVRSVKLGEVLLGMIIIKLSVANVLTSIIMGRNRTLAGAVGRGRAAAKVGMEEEVKETHPVIILFAVVISGEIWGAVGMLISVPVISFLRLAANIWFLPTFGVADKEA